MTRPRATVCIAYHYDAVSTWLWVYDSWNAPTRHTRGLFGVVEGTPRLLDLHDRHDIPSTWHVPGHTIESFPESCGEIHDRGHDIEHHGWTHQRFAGQDDYEAERADFERGVDAIYDLTGRKPTGYSSTAWEFSEHTLDILLDLGFEWDSSQMASDFNPYYVRRGWEAPADGPYEWGEETDLVELPVSWQRDDWPPFTFTWANPYMMAFVDEASVFRKWRDAFDWMYDNVDGGVFVLTLHPQVIGQAHRLSRLDDLLGHMRSKPDVEFATGEEAARAWREANPR
jgi:peptidoglycan/xylan/chitin deacetylase (PgdA/CDA1 family)